MMSLTFPEPFHPLTPDRWPSYLIVGYIPPLAKKRGYGKKLFIPQPSSVRVDLIIENNKTLEGPKSESVYYTVSY